MNYPKIKVRKDHTNTPVGYDYPDCGGDVCCDCCMKYGLHGHLPAEQHQHFSDFYTEAIQTLQTILAALEGEDDRPFIETELIDAIEEYAAAVCYGERLLVWVPLDSLTDFINPLLSEVIEDEQLPILLYEGLAMFDLTELCED